MADNDGDSHMDSPPDLFDLEDVTPDNTTTDPSIISPPDSQRATDMPTSAPGANSNGKRPLNIIREGMRDQRENNAAVDVMFPVRLLSSPTSFYMETAMERRASAFKTPLFCATSRGRGYMYMQAGKLCRYTTLHT
ncbi:hypothetical protein LTR12_001523 [Friedmanniomyces endolithicus]|nr:hypothetical protein LTR12_001523 [Friedmanniomyces endolithicus]